MSTVSVRYIVDDVDAAIVFYRDRLGFRELMHPDPAFAMLTHGDLRLVLVAPVPAGHPGGGSRPMPDGTAQRPGGFDLQLVRGFPAAGVPLIAFGGVSEPAQLEALLEAPNVVAVGVGTFLAYREHAVQKLRQAASARSIRAAVFSGAGG